MFRRANNFVTKCLAKKSLSILEALPGGGGSQVTCRNFKMSRVGVLLRVHVAVGN